MTLLSAHQSRTSTKLLLLGHPGTGKTGALASLVKAGYKLRILDFDNKLAVLRAYVMRDCPDKIGNVEFVTLRDKYKDTPSVVTSGKAVHTANPVDGQPKAFPLAQKLIGNWKYDDVDLGKPSEWGEDCILVIDSSTTMGIAAFNWAWFMNPGAAEMRNVYKSAQDAFENIVAIITGDAFKPNVILITHIRYMDGPEGTMKGFPTAVGAALGPVIPMYFPSTAMMENSGSGDKVVRQMRIVPTAMIDLMNSAPFAFNTSTLPIATGLADFFKTVRGEK